MADSGNPSKSNKKEDPLKISKMRGLAAGAVTACLLLGSGVSVASAAPAVWNTPGSGSTTTTTPLLVTVKISPGYTITYSCAPGDFVSQGFSASNSPYGGQATLGFVFEAFCTSPAGPHTAHINYYGPSAGDLRGEKVGGAYQLKGTDSAMLTIASGQFWQSNLGRGVSYTVPWTNGANPLNPVSTATFNDTQVGKTVGGQAITFTGVVRFKTSANGLLTLI